jgi:hypothetical protein
MSYVTPSATAVSKRWATYAIDRVRHGSHPTHIDAVRIREVLSNGSVSATTTLVARAWVVQQIEAGYVFKTITETVPGSGDWYIGALVQIEIVDRVKYLRTVANGTAGDNLGTLPQT